MSDKTSIFNELRIIPKETEYLDKRLGANGEIFFDKGSQSLRIYDGITIGGYAILRADLENIEGQISSVIPSADPPTDVDSGTVWFNTNNGKIYILYNDGNSSQWVQPTSVVYGSGEGSGSGVSTLNGLNDVVIASPSSGQVLKYNGTAWVNGTDNVGSGEGGGVVALVDLEDVVLTAPTTGQVLKYNGTSWVNDADATGSAASNSFQTIAISGQSSVIADSSTDTLNLVGGTGITLTTDAGSDTVTITCNVTGGATQFTGLTDVSAASLTIDKIYLPAITRLVVDNNGVTAYTFDQYTGDNPTIYAISGTTIAFDLNAIEGHPFVIQDGSATNYNTGLVHVTATGVVSTGTNAQGKTSGTLYWKIPASISGSYRYQCGAHVAMVGNITIKGFAAI